MRGLRISFDTLTSFNDQRCLIMLTASTCIRSSYVRSTSDWLQENMIVGSGIKAAYLQQLSARIQPFPSSGNVQITPMKPFARTTKHCASKFTHVKYGICR